jgi:hypothetical protein
MAQYMLLIRDNLEGYSRYSKEDLAKLIEKMMEWSSQLKKAGIHKGAEKLTDDPGKVLRKRNAQVVVDGPFAEAKELIGGYFLVEAENEAEAVRIAKECPALLAASEIDVRKVADVCGEVVLLRGK